MIDLANKCVLVRTHEEYENILKAAKKQGYRWYGGKEVYPYPFEEQQIPDILKFYSNKELTRNSSLAPGYELLEASACDRIYSGVLLWDFIARNEVRKLIWQESTNIGFLKKVKCFYKAGLETV